MVHHSLWINLLDPSDKSILEMPKPNTKLTFLGLNSNRINNSGAEALCTTLPWTNISVTALPLYGNNNEQSIDEEGLCVTSNGFSLRGPYALRLFYQATQFILKPLYLTYQHINKWLTLETHSNIKKNK